MDAPIEQDLLAKYSELGYQQPPTRTLSLSFSMNAKVRVTGGELRASQKTYTFEVFVETAHWPTGDQVGMSFEQTWKLISTVWRAVV